MRTSLPVALGCILLHQIHGADDGLAETPPMGWRSWNLYGGDVSQDLILEMAHAALIRRDPAGNRDPNGISLKDLGYNDIGLDDNWQDCQNEHTPEHTFHDKFGRPIINTELFPDMKLMVQEIHRLGLKAGWYHNNCICRETTDTWTDYQHYVGDVEYTFRFGFDSVKLDGCGAFLDLDIWYELFGGRVLIENCHWGGDKPQYVNGTLWCPFHMYRTSGDITNTWESMFHNLKTTIGKISVPGCWAYPDMLEVGLLADAREDRAHFGAWVITSSPLILSHNMTDDTTARRIWKIISNTQALAIHKTGLPGSIIFEVPGDSGHPVQVWQKNLTGSSVALLVLNANDRNTTHTMQYALDDTYQVYDVWEGKHLGSHSTLPIHLDGHDSLFYRLDPIHTTV